MTTQTKQGQTPGPWKLIGWLVCRDKGIKYAIADVMTTAALSDEEKEANGRLIATAPELLEACKLAAQEYEAKRDLMPQIIPSSAVWAAMEAIKKAEGKE